MACPEVQVYRKGNSASTFRFLSFESPRINECPALQGAAVFLTLFGLPFLERVGLYLRAVGQPRKFHHHPHGLPRSYSVWVFASIGGGLIYAAIGGYGG